MHPCSTAALGPLRSSCDECRLAAESSVPTWQAGPGVRRSGPGPCVGGGGGRNPCCRCGCHAVRPSGEARVKASLVYGRARGHAIVTASMCSASVSRSKPVSWSPSSCGLRSSSNARRCACWACACCRGRCCRVCSTCCVRKWRVSFSVIACPFSARSRVVGVASPSWPLRVAAPIFTLHPSPCLR